ncbi:hypothetical protein V3C99_009116 [Haemonchus contortus]
MKSLIFILIVAAVANWASGLEYAWCSWSEKTSQGMCHSLLTGKTVHFTKDPSYYFGQFVPSTTPSPFELAHPWFLNL